MESVLHTVSGGRWCPPQTPPPPGKRLAGSRTTFEKPATSSCLPSIACEQSAAHSFKSWGTAVQAGDSIQAENCIWQPGACCIVPAIQAARPSIAVQAHSQKTVTLNLMLVCPCSFCRTASGHSRSAIPDKPGCEQFASRLLININKHPHIADVSATKDVSDLDCIRSLRDFGCRALGSGDARGHSISHRYLDTVTSACLWFVP